MTTEYQHTETRQNGKHPSETGPPANGPTDTALSLTQSEVRYRRLFESAQDGILILDAESGRIEDVNPFLQNLLGYTREEFVDKQLWELGAFYDIEENKEAFKELQKHEYIRYEDLPLKTKSGALVDVEFVSNVYDAGGAHVIQCNIRDITASKQIARDLRLSEELFRARLENSTDLVAEIAEDGTVLYVSPSIERILGYSLQEFIGSNIYEIIHQDDLQRTMLGLAEIVSELGKTAKAETRLLHQDGSWRLFEGAARTYLNAMDEVVIILNSLDITERRISEMLILREVGVLTITGEIDRLIASNQDLGQVLKEILIHVAKELGVDAANILIFSPDSQQLTFAAAHGFRSERNEQVSLGLGESYAGWAAGERITVQNPDAEGRGDLEFFAKNFPQDDFVYYFGVPLIARGELKGVLEVFNRTELVADANWLDFLHSLADQTALALEGAAKVEKQKQSDFKLKAAYNSTIEGWSQALDLRDEETQGHSLRVTLMTEKLAVLLKFPQAELINIRWGALLHDIGKMGIPDNILLKTGPLTDDEWVVMKRHPQYALQLLSPIRYLREALDIPYCHHEKWDGSGYPRGLQGDQIPLAARIFAVVDVWDALTSERPYREAWTQEQALDYIRDSSGTHFDPQVVEMFLSTRAETKPKL